MINKIIKYVKENNLINQNDKILVAFSGGPDSVCLLNILYELKEQLHIVVGAVHINHMLRAKDADMDEEYVKEFCEKRDIPCYVKKIDINKYSKENKLSSEAAGRKVRYEFFDKIAVEHGYNKIATAHNANDQAETIMFRMIRGSGLEGLTGIKNIRDNKIIRPILCLKRSEIEDYIKEKNLNPRIDKTNFEKDYNRNKIRLDILPYIQKNFNENIIETLNRMGIQFQKDNDYLENESAKSYNRYCKDEKDRLIIMKEAFLSHEAIITRVVKKALIKFSKVNYDFEMKHIYDILKLSKNQTGKIINMPNNIVAENIYGDIELRRVTEICDKCTEKYIEIKKSEINKKSLTFNDYSISFNVLEDIEDNKLNKEEFTRYFNFDKIDDRVVIRNKKDGDRMKPFGMKCNKKVKDIFINMKIPKEIRNSIPIICFDEDIAYIPQCKISDDYKVTGTNDKILKITIKKRS